MLFRFGVILTPDSSDLEVFVLGSRAEMGQWDPDRAVQMRASHNFLSPHEPCLWIGDVQLAEPFKDTLWFKFIKRSKGTSVWEGTEHFAIVCVRRHTSMTYPPTVKLTVVMPPYSHMMALKSRCLTSK